MVASVGGFIGFPKGCRFSEIRRNKKVKRQFPGFNESGRDVWESTGSIMKMTSDAYGQAYQDGFNITIRMLASRGIDQESAREVAQAAWVKGWERLDQLRDENFVISWVNSIALNCYRSVLRERARTIPAIGTAGTEEFNFARLEIAQISRLCLPGDRKLLEQQARGVTAEELARAEGLTLMAARLRFFRARAAARRRLQARTDARSV